jgi:RNA 2',3'-cyclic 3'-phosphodiesterase
VRLFVALWPPPDAVSELLAAVDEVRTDAPRLRWTAPEKWHLTLAFLGEVPDDRRPELEERLARAANRHPPLTLRFAGGGRFGTRVLFTRVDGDREPLVRLAASVGAAARRSRIPVDDRPYRPHLTLARGRGDDDLRPLAAQLGTFIGRAWTATSIDLVESRLGQGPDRTARYESAASWPLTGRPLTGRPPADR